MVGGGCIHQVMDVCQAMADMGIVHFDLKADNLLLLPAPGVSEAEFWAPTTTTPPFTCVVADFGESKLYPALHTKMTAPAEHYYSQDDIKEMIKYGKTNGIRVVPEFVRLHPTTTCRLSPRGKRR